MTDAARPTRLCVVRDHYGAGVTAFEITADGAPLEEPRPFPSFDAAVARWRVDFGLGEARVVDDRFGRWVVEFE